MAATTSRHDALLADSRPLLKLQDLVRADTGEEGKVILIEPSGAFAIIVLHEPNRLRTEICRISTRSLTSIKAYTAMAVDPPAG
jgi:hypothetical protein